MISNEFRLFGYFGCFDLVDPNGEEIGNTSDIANNFLQELHNNHIITMYRPPNFHIAPPLITTKEELDICFDRIEKAVKVIDDKFY